MKRMILTVMVLMAAGFLYAQESGTYTVQSVSGRVEQEISGGRWAAVKAGDVITGETVIRTGINSTLVFRVGEQNYTIGAVQTGKASLFTQEAAGVHIGGRVATTDTQGVSRTTGRVSTASARASDSAAEADTDAE